MKNIKYSPKIIRNFYFVTFCDMPNDTMLYIVAYLFETYWQKLLHN